VNPSIIIKFSKRVVEGYSQKTKSSINIKEVSKTLNRVNIMINKVLLRLSWGVFRYGTVKKLAFFFWFAN
jgi:hypothetical protein